MNVHPRDHNKGSKNYVRFIIDQRTLWSKCFLIQRICTQYVVLTSNTYPLLLLADKRLFLFVLFCKTRQSESLQWEYVQWLEHFALICETSGMHLKSAMILENAVHYAHLFGSTGGAIQSCLLFSIAGALFSAAGSEKREHCPSSRDGGSAAFDKRLESGTGRIIRDLVHSTSPDKLIDQYEKAARVYLKKLEVLVTSSFGSLALQNYPGVVPFMARCLKRSSTKMFNYTINVQHSAKYQMYHQIVTR